MLAESVASQSHHELSGSAIADARRAAAKAHLQALGLTISAWADRHGYNRRTVYKVLGGALQGNYGVAHNIAVRLGVRNGEIDPAHEPAVMTEASRG